MSYLHLSNDFQGGFERLRLSARLPARICFACSAAGHGLGEACDPILQLLRERR